MLPLHGSERCGVGKIADSNNDDRGERGTMEDGHVRSGHSDRGSGRGKFRRWSRFAGSGRSTSSSSEQRRIPGILSRRTSPFALLPLPLPVAGCRLPLPLLGGVSGVAAVVEGVEASVTSGGSSNVGANASDVGGDGAEAEELETGDGSMDARI